MRDHAIGGLPKTTHDAEVKMASKVDLGVENPWQDPRVLKKVVAIWWVLWAVR